MWSAKNYRLGFDPWGLALFLVIMLPNFCWSVLPAPNDVMRNESVTPAVDLAAQVFQIAMVAAICAVINITRDAPMKRGYLVGTSACVALYFAGWAAYYAGIANAAVILDLCLAPCGAFLFHSAARKNAPALLAAGGFAACHLISTIANFIL